MSCTRNCLAYIQRPHRMSDVPPELYVLPSSHSTHDWKWEPLVVELNWESRQTMLSAVVPAVSVAHLGVHGELGATSRA